MRRLSSTSRDRGQRDISGKLFYLCYLFQLTTIHYLFQLTATRLYRKARALVGLEQYEDAKQAVIDGLQYEPNDKVRLFFLSSFFTFIVFFSLTRKS